MLSFASTFVAVVSSTLQQLPSMPTISDDFSDPEDVLLDDAALPATSTTASSSGPASRGDVPLPAASVGPDGVPVIPKAVKIGPYGQLFQVDQDEFKRCGSTPSASLATRR